jgi:phosphohistidine phosphatase
MQLLVIRHAIAEERGAGASAVLDAERTLTGEGKRKMRRAARGLQSLVPQIDLLVTSPLVRAVQTAEIVEAAYEAEIATERSPELSPGQSPEAFAEWLASRRLGQVVAAVGHEPGLSHLVSWMMSGLPRSIIELKKGGVCVLDCPEGPVPGTAVLLWSLRPGHLRSLRT